MSRVFKYETPPWGAALICSTYIVVSGALIVLYWNYESWAGASEWPVKYVFLVLGLVFLLVSLKPTNWKGWVYFSADYDGMHFPSSPSAGGELTSLDVSWENVGNIQCEKLYGGSHGISIELNISRREVDEYFGDAALANKLLGFTQMRGEYFVIAYANNAFQKLPSVVSHLLELKNARAPLDDSI